MHHLHKHILSRHTILHCSAILHAQQQNTKLSVTSPSRTASSGIFATLQLRWCQRPRPPHPPTIRPMTSALGFRPLPAFIGGPMIDTGYSLLVAGYSQARGKKNNSYWRADLVKRGDAQITKPYGVLSCSSIRPIVCGRYPLVNQHSQGNWPIYSWFTSTCLIYLLPIVIPQPCEFARV